MAAIEIYSTQYCGYCRRAKSLLDSKGAAYTQIDVSGDPERRAEMMARSNGQRTVPQIFINGHHVGGCSELFQLDQAGKLDAMLEREQDKS